MISTNFNQLFSAVTSCWYNTAPTPEQVLKNASLNWSINEENWSINEEKNIELLINLSANEQITNDQLDHFLIENNVNQNSNYISTLSELSLQPDAKRSQPYKAMELFKALPNELLNKIISIVCLPSLDSIISPMADIEKITLISKRFYSLFSQAFYCQKIAEKLFPRLMSKKEFLFPNNRIDLKFIAKYCNQYFLPKNTDDQLNPSLEAAFLKANQTIRFKNLSLSKDDEEQLLNEIGDANNRSYFNIPESFLDKMVLKVFKIHQYIYEADRFEHRLQSEIKNQFDEKMRVVPMRNCIEDILETL